MKHRIAAATFGAALVLSGCTGPTGNSDVPSSTSVPLVPSSVSVSPRPPLVTQPKDLHDIAACDLLTGPQLVELGLRPESGRHHDGELALGCAWVSGDGNQAFAMIATERANGGLRGLYQLHDVFEVFEPGQVSGYPSVRAGADDSVCHLYVGVADDRMISVDGNVAGRPLPDPCEPSRRMAAFVLSNLPDLQ